MEILILKGGGAAGIGITYLSFRGLSLDCLFLGSTSWVSLRSWSCILSVVVAGPDFKSYFFVFSVLVLRSMAWLYLFLDFWLK